MKLISNDGDSKLKKLVTNSYKSLQIEGNGKVSIDPEEVKNTESAMKLSKEIVDNNNKIEMNLL